MDFDLSQALEDFQDSDVAGLEPRCFDMTEVEDRITRIDNGLDLVITRDKMTMKNVAHLVLVVNKLKKTLISSDEELCSVIMESLVDETVVEMVVDPCTGCPDRFFLRSDSHSECTLCDDRQKAVIITGGDLKLQAITLKGGHTDHKVYFKLSKYETSVGGDGLTVVLSIKNKSNLHMSCLMEGDKAVLSLEECTEEKLNHINNDGNLERFLFYKRTKGLSDTTFESVKCPGWFISTSSDKENEPLEMCRQDTAYRLTSFRIN